MFFFISLDWLIHCIKKFPEGIKDSLHMMRANCGFLQHCTWSVGSIKESILPSAGFPLQKRCVSSMGLAWLNNKSKYMCDKNLLVGNNIKMFWLSDEVSGCSKTVCLYIPLLNSVPLVVVAIVADAVNSFFSLRKRKQTHPAPLSRWFATIIKRHDSWISCFYLGGE